jgi:hypothetical protein
VHDLVPVTGVPAPAVATWSEALLEAVAAQVGVPVGYAAVPEALDHGHGPWAFGFALAPASDPIPEPWAGGLVVRLATDRRDLDREAAAMTLSRSHDRGAPVVLDIVELDVAGRPDALLALVTGAVTDVALPELIGFNLHQADDILHGFAAHHDAIHRLPVDDLVAVPAVDAAAEVARIDATRFPAERAWLDERIPSPTEVVLCHGGYQPLSVFGPPPAEWDRHGGPGRGLTVTNWCGAVRAEPEYDMAFTLVAFWSAPYFAKNRPERTAIKMIRNTLLNTYKLGYAAQRDVDPDRLRFWQAFHALRGTAIMNGAYDGDGSPYRPQDRGPLPDDLASELPRLFRQLTRVR